MENGGACRERDLYFDTMLDVEQGPPPELWIEDYAKNARAAHGKIDVNVWEEAPSSTSSSAGSSSSSTSTVGPPKIESIIERQNDRLAEYESKINHLQQQLKDSQNMCRQLKSLICNSHGGHQILSPPTDLDHKSLREPLGRCFGKVEHLVRRLPLVPLKFLNPYEDIFLGYQNLLRYGPDEDKMLEIHQFPYCLITAFICDVICKKVLTDGVLHHFKSPFQTEYQNLYHDEMIMSKGHRATDIAMRYSLAGERARYAELITAFPSFWTWLPRHTEKVVDDIASMVRTAFPSDFEATLRVGLLNPVAEALSVAVQMRKKPYTVFYTWPFAGSIWNPDEMVHRNTEPELIGHELPNGASLVTRYCVKPLIQAKYFPKGSELTVNLHHAQVHLGLRKHNLLPLGGHGHRRH